MNVITQNCGFWHIAEAISMQLPMKDIVLLRKINQKWREMIDRPHFSRLHLTANAKYGSYEEATRIVHKYDSSIHQNQDGFTLLF